MGFVEKGSSANRIESTDLRCLVNEMLWYSMRHRLRQFQSSRLNKRGDDLMRRGDLTAAEACFRAVLAADARHALAHSNLGNTLMGLHRYDEALMHLEQAVQLAPRHVGVLVNLGNAYFRGGATAAAAQLYGQALDIDPHAEVALANIVRPLLELCDWDALDRHLATLRAHLSAAAPGAAVPVSPFDSIFLPFTRAEQLDIARRYAAGFRGIRSIERRTSSASRLRIGYLSGDFHDHPTVHLTMGLYAAHDRSVFEITGYSIGIPDSGRHRQTIAAQCDRFFDLYDRDATQIARKIADDGIDILVDLKGYTGGARPEILAQRPAPVQVNYLGYPGTMGAPFIDYLIADPIIIPDVHRADYAEQVVALPVTYQPTDPHQAVSATPITRLEAGLPEAAFVYCCFNNSAKIDRRTFTSWLAVLAAVPESVLWLLDMPEPARLALCVATGRAGVDANRLIFAPIVPKAEHLARLRLADLALDTFLCNAHTTATDALYAGTPMLTLIGETFASRVGASLVTAAGLPELVVSSEREFVRMAVSLAGDRSRLAVLKDALRRPGMLPLFDAPRYVRELEAAYRQMMER